jgi:hypothetical protein
MKRFVLIGLCLLSLFTPAIAVVDPQHRSVGDLGGGVDRDLLEGAFGIEAIVEG